MRCPPAIPCPGFVPTLSSHPQTETINEMPLYPTEAVLFDENQVPTVHYTGEQAGPVGRAPQGFGGRR